MLAKGPLGRPTAEDVERRLAGIQSATSDRRNRRFPWPLAAALAACLAAGAAFWLMRDRLFPHPEPVLTQLTAQVSENRVTAAALSPDGKTLAFAALGGPVFLRRITSSHDALEDQSGDGGHLFHATGSRSLVLKGSASFRRNRIRPANTK